MESRRKIIFFKDYFHNFFHPLSDRLKEKFDYVLFLVEVAKRIPAKFFKHLKGSEGLFEIRVEYQSNIYRVFCCFDEDRLVVLFNGFQKKSQKTPKSELEKALIRQEYFGQKDKSTWKRR